MRDIAFKRASPYITWMGDSMSLWHARVCILGIGVCRILNIVANTGVDFRKGIWDNEIVLEVKHTSRIDTLRMCFACG